MTSVLKRTKVLLSSEGQGQNYGTALNASHPRAGSDIDVERIADDRDERRAKGGLRRGLSARQVQMIAIGGTIGTGLFLGTGRSLAQGGPASLLICYALVGFIVYVTLLHSETICKQWLYANHICQSSSDYTCNDLLAGNPLQIIK